MIIVRDRFGLIFFEEAKIISLIIIFTLVSKLLFLENHNQILLLLYLLIFHKISFRQYQFWLDAHALHQSHTKRKYLFIFLYVHYRCFRVFSSGYFHLLRLYEHYYHTNLLRLRYLSSGIIDQSSCQEFFIKRQA